MSKFKEWVVPTSKEEDMDGRSRIEKASVAQNDLEDISYELVRLAKAAEMLGMIGLVDRLYTMAEDVKINAEILHKCWSDEFNHHCDDVQQGSHNMIAAAFAALGVKEKP